MFHSPSVNMSEKESLLGNHTDSTCYSSVRMHDQPPNCNDLDTTSSVNVFRSRSVLRNPSEDFYNRGIPIWRAVLLVVNAALGAGILNFPQAYAKCGGIGTALAFQMVREWFILKFIETDDSPKSIVNCRRVFVESYTLITCRYQSVSVEL